MKYGFGIDVGGTTVKLAFFEEDGTMIDKWEIPTHVQDGGSHILPEIAQAVSDYLAQKNIDRSQVIGIGIGVPGPVDEQGVVNKCINLGWGVFNIARELETLTGLPVKAGNDANVAALGEYWKGGGQGCRSMVLVTLGTGVGGGIILDGHVLHGAHGSAAEIGHMVINRGEIQRCSCGKYGCVEQYCSATGIVLLAHRVMAASVVDTPLRQLHDLTCKDVFDYAKEGDMLAQEVLRTFYAYMGEFLANVCDVIDPEMVVIGGGVSKAGQMLLDGIRPQFDKNIFHAAQGARFALAKLGNDAGSYGAFKLIKDSVN